mgnify:CR=1 FL=1|tara:strand:- start:349 stop:729 length:381 start_codon:yes stop_codon:yes gene_type:complete
MKQYIAVVSSDAGKITKYQDFDTQAEADTHVADFGGFVSAKPSDSTGYWVVGVDTLTYDAAQEAADTLSNSWAAIRTKRNTLISATDWRVLPDQPVSQPWLDYRQALRDLPDSQADPDDIVFPDAP